MLSTTTSRYLRRYTDLPALLHMLETKKITLLDPKTWDDQNDSFFMSLFKEKKQLKTVLALCFSQTNETYHHWRVFSNGPAGVCVVFDREALLAKLKKIMGIRISAIRYAVLKKEREKGLKLNELPFVKRYGFKPEKEFRVIYTSSSEENPSLDVSIDLSIIRSVSLSPWMHSSLRDSTVAAIRAIEGCAKLKVSRSTLISNEQWKTLGKTAT